MQRLKMNGLDSLNNAPEECDSRCSKKILRQHRLLIGKLALPLIESVPAATIILNKEREIVLYNNFLTSVLSDENKHCILGKRPGELLGCSNAQEKRCGESNACEQCGALIAIRTALSGSIANEECTLLSNSTDSVKSYTFKVSSSPLVIEGEDYCIVYLTDISDRKHKEVLEKVFLHDLLNAVNGIINAGTLLKEETANESSRELAQMVVERAKFMGNEINAHRLFMSAENNQLEVENSPVPVRKILESICTLLAGSSLAKSKNISITTSIEEFEVITDKRIFHRIIENLIKNAIEASPENATVTVIASKINESALFTVSNQGVIPMVIAYQIFKKSFSTKGQGRGFGTYSVKLFTENYLDGKAWFESSVEDGTNFYVRIPLIPKKHQQFLT